MTIRSQGGRIHATSEASVEEVEGRQRVANAQPEQQQLVTAIAHTNLRTGQVTYTPLQRNAAAAAGAAGRKVTPKFDYHPPPPAHPRSRRRGGKGRSGDNLEDQNNGPTQITVEFSG